MEDLAKKGWHLTVEGQEQCRENSSKPISVDSVIKAALNLDLRSTGEKWLPIDLSSRRVKVDHLEGPAVLQILKLRNVSAPKENEESQAAPRLWKITLTDGHASVAAVCLEPLKNLSLVTPPGTKLLIEGTIGVKNGYLLLTNKTARLLGGHVPSLVESWQLKRKLAGQSRLGIQSEGGPPLFVPFGQKMSKTRPPSKVTDDFKSLANAAGQIEEEENSEFQQQRQATIAEAESLTSKTKTFGGGQKASVSDKDLARIMEMGFTSDQASNALRQSGGSVSDAIEKLVGGHLNSQGYDLGQGRNRGGGAGRRGDGFMRGAGDRREQHEEGEQNGRRGGWRGGGRRGRGNRFEEDEDDVSSCRPSGPTTLFDFLETKIPSKSENQDNGRKQRPASSGPAQKFSSDQRADQRPQTATGDCYSSQRSQSYSFNHSHSQTQYGTQDGRDSRNIVQNADSAFRSFDDHSQGKGKGFYSSADGVRSNNSQHKHQRMEGSVKSSSQRKEAKDSQGMIPTSEIEVRFSGHGKTQDKDARHKAQISDSAYTTPTNRRDDKKVRDDGARQMNFSDQRQKNQSSQQASQRDDVSRSELGALSRSNKNGNQDKSFNNSSRYAGGGGDVECSRPNQSHPRSWQEQNSNKDGGTAGGCKDRPQSGGQPKQAGNQRFEREQSGFGQRENFGQQWQQHRHDGPPQSMWQRGQFVLAKYWEDNQLYRAVVEAMAENGRTAVVTFMDYGNQEEVLCSDIHPLQPYPLQPYPQQNGSQSAVTSSRGYFPGGKSSNTKFSHPPGDDQGFDLGYIPQMEFRRGGSGPTHRRQQEPNNRRRPTQNFYMPPNRN